MRIYFLTGKSFSALQSCCGWSCKVAASTWSWCTGWWDWEDCWSVRVTLVAYKRISLWAKTYTSHNFVIIAFEVKNAKKQIYMNLTLKCLFVVSVMHLIPYVIYVKSTQLRLSLPAWKNENLYDLVKLEKWFGAVLSTNRNRLCAVL